MSYSIANSPETLPFMDLVKRGAHAALQLWPKSVQEFRGCPPIRLDSSENTGGAELAREAGPAVGASSPKAQIATAYRLVALREALSAALSISSELVGVDEVDPPDVEIWAFGINCLMDIDVGANPPLLMPLQQGALSAEWHAHGINLELRFRGRGDVYAVIEDARGELATFFGRDPKMGLIRQAARALADRSR